MNNFEETNVERLDVESLIVDLLASGLGASIILFFIFSVCILTTSAYTSNAPRGKTVDNTGNGLVALVGESPQNKNLHMLAVRAVELDELDENMVALLKREWKKNPGKFWDNGRLTTKDSLHTEQQLMIRKNKLSFVFLADAIRSGLQFKIPALAELKDQKAVLRIHFLEGQSIKYDFNGYMSYPDTRHPGRDINSLAGLVITFYSGKASNNTLYKLINLEEH